MKYSATCQSENQKNTANVAFIPEHFFNPYSTYLFSSAPRKCVSLTFARHSAVPVVIPVVVSWGCRRPQPEADLTLHWILTLILYLLYRLVFWHKHNQRQRLCELIMEEAYHAFDKLKLGRNWIWESSPYVDKTHVLFL